MITSRKNPKIQWVRGLLSQRSEREKGHVFIAEGVRLNEEALINGWLPNLILFCQPLSQRGKQVLDGFRDQGSEVEEVDPQVMQSLSDTDTPQGILAVLPIREIPLSPGWDFLLILDGLRDPGNAGSILRTATAAGVNAIVVTPGSIDPFSPKVVRAGMGAHFRLPIYFRDWPQISELCNNHHNQPASILISDVNRGTSCWDTDLRGPVALVIGSEAEGAQPQAYQSANGLIHIPMPGKSESLNAAAAAAILLFETARQRSL